MLFGRSALEARVVVGPQVGNRGTGMGMALPLFTGRKGKQQGRQGAERGKWGMGSWGASGSELDSNCLNIPFRLS